MLERGGGVPARVLVRALVGVSDMFLAVLLSAFGAVSRLFMYLFHVFFAF